MPSTIIAEAKLNIRNRFTICGALLLLSVGFNHSLDAQIQVYSSNELASRDSLYRNFLFGVFEEDLKSRLPLADRTRAADIRLVLPTNVTGNLLAVGAHVPTGRIFFPMETIAFLDDLAALAGWLAARDCSFEPAALYAGMIAVKQKPYGWQSYPNPRAAFGLGDDVWNDQFVKKSSNQVLKTATYFILAHELAHVLYGHAPYENVSPSQARQQELEADAYALRMMRHIGVPPLGMFHFFTVLSRVEGVIPTTHPLSGQRLMQIVNALENYPADFVPPNESPSHWAPIIQTYANGFRGLVPVIDNPELRANLTAQARNARWSELAQLC